MVTDMMLADANCAASFVTMPEQADVIAANAVPDGKMAYVVLANRPKSFSEGRQRARAGEDRVERGARQRRQHGRDLQRVNGQVDLHLEAHRSQTLLFYGNR